MDRCQPSALAWFLILTLPVAGYAVYVALDYSGPRPTAWRKPLPLLVLALSVVELYSLVVTFNYLRVQEDLTSSPSFESAWRFFAQMGLVALPFLVVVGTAISGPWLLLRFLAERRRRLLQRRCLACGYRYISLPEQGIHTCPECGAVITWF